MRMLPSQGFDDKLENELDSEDGDYDDESDEMALDRWTLPCQIFISKLICGDLCHWLNIVIGQVDATGGRTCEGKGDSTYH